MKAFNAVLVAMAWLGRAVRCEKMGVAENLRARLRQKSECTEKLSTSECSMQNSSSSAMQ